MQVAMGSARLKWCHFAVYVWVILGIAINYLVQLKFIYYHRSGNNNICHGVCKFGIICKWKICCIWDNCKDFGNLEESLCQGSLFDTKTWTCYWKGVFAPMLWQQIFSCFIIWPSEDIKNECPIRKSLLLLRMEHQIFKTFISSKSQIMKEKVFMKVFVSNTVPWHRDSSKLPKSWGSFQPKSTEVRNRCFQIFFIFLPFVGFYERSISWKYQLHSSIQSYFIAV